MKRIEIKKEIRVVIELTEREAKLLAELVQNPISDVETEEFLKLRADLFTTLTI